MHCSSEYELEIRMRQENPDGGSAQQHIRPRPSSLDIYFVGLARDLDLELSMPLNPNPETTQQPGPSEKPATTTSMTWKPFLLQRRTISAFLVIFVGMAISLESLFIISEKRQGLLATTPGLYYAWTYGPAAVFTILSAIWSCVDFSAKIASPWLENGPENQDIATALLTDYVSMFPVFVPFRAIRNRNVLVASTSLVSLMLSVTVVFAPSLVRRSLVEAASPVTLLTEFMDDPSRLTQPGLLPLYNSIGRKRYGMDYPLGIQGQYVFQTFSPSPAQVSSFHTTVSALSFELQCEEATLTQLAVSVPEIDPYEAFPTISLTLGLQSSSCDSITFAQLLSFRLASYRSINGSQEFWMSKVLTVQCGADSNGPGAQRILWLVVELGLSLSFKDIYILTGVKVDGLRNSKQLICNPHYSMADIDVFQEDHAGYKVSPARDTPTRKLDNITAWDITKALIYPYSTAFMYANSGEGSTSTIISTIRYEELSLISGLDAVTTDFDDLSIAIIGLDVSSYPDMQSVLNYSSLASSFQRYYQAHSTFLAQSALMKETTGLAPGYAMVTESRLVVQILACQILSALCLVSALILVAALWAHPTHLLLSGDPRTIGGLIVLAQDLAAGFPKGLGAAKLSELTKQVGRWTMRLNRQGHRSSLVEEESLCASHARDINNPITPGSFLLRTEMHHPFSLRDPTRALLCIVVIGIVTTLEILLRKSQRDHGIGPAHSTTYLRYTWTVLPALLLGLTGMWFSAIDFELRTLVPFHALSHGLTSYRRSIGLNLRGMLIPAALHRELRTKHYAAAAATVALVFTSFLTIIPGSIFVDTYMPAVSRDRLRLVGSFSDSMYHDDYMIVFGAGSGTGHGVNDFGILSTLVLLSNLSYPPNTFKELALPVLEFENTTLISNRPIQSNISDLETRAVIPALRGGLSCYPYSKAEVSADILPNSTDINIALLRVNITGQFKSLDPLPLELSVTNFFTLNRSQASEGIFASSYRANCRSHEYLYIWGNYSHWVDNTTSSLSVFAALGCNATIEAVDVEASFFGAKLAIRPEKPPQPIEDTARSVIPGNHAQQLWGLYQDLFSAQSEQNVLLDDFFKILTMSQYGVPFSELADPSKVGAVEDAIKRQHAIILAQALSSTARAPNWEHPGEVGVFDRLGKGTLNSTRYDAIVLDSSRGEQRVTQDETSTRLLQALLGGALVFGLLSWGLSPRKGVLPRPPTSPASVLALLVDGNVYHTGTLEQIELLAGTELGDKPMFRMGLGRLDPDTSGDDRTRDDDRDRYGIWVDE